MQLYNKKQPMSIQKLYPLAIGPDVRGRTYTGCIVNGVRYHVQRRDELRKSQNCGVVVAGYHENELIDFYGMRKADNFTSIYVKRFWYEHDSFVLATQAKQVFYIDDPKLGENWRIVLKFQDRHLYDVPEKENSEAEGDELHITTDEVYQDISLENNSIVNDTVDILSQLHRDDVDSVTLNANVIELEAQMEHEVEIDYNKDQ